MVSRYSAMMEFLLDGTDYGTDFGYVLLGEAETLNAVRQSIKNSFPKSKPFKTEFLKVPEAKFWEKIEYGINYKGRNLNSKEEEDLSVLQKKYKEEIRKNIKQDSKFYSYSSDIGIPIKTFIWSFSLIYNNGREWFFVYGSASD